MGLFDMLHRTFFDFSSMAEVLPQLLKVGLMNTLIISIAATLLGTSIGLVLALMGISPSRWLRVPSRIYTDLFRGLPSILTILLIGQGLARYSYELFGPSPIRWASCPQPDCQRLYGRNFSRRDQSVEKASSRPAARWA